MVAEVEELKELFSTSAEVRLNTPRGSTVAPPKPPVHVSLDHFSCYGGSKQGP